MGNLTTLDVLVLAGYLTGISVVGAVFYRRRADLREYFVAGRQIPALVVVVGLAASYTSSISYLGVPSYAYRVNLVPLASLFAAPLALWVVARMFLPFFFKLNVITCYEYLDLRFGRATHRTASVLFLISRMLWLVLVSYGTAVALKFAIPVPLPAALEQALRSVHVDPSIAFWVFVLGVLGTTYTMLGGIRAVMWTDLLQFTMLCSGLIATIAIAWWASGKSLAAIWETASAAGRTRLFDFRFSWTGDNFWAALAGGFFIAMSDQGLDQIAAQRYLSAKSLADSQRSAVLSLLVNIPLNLLLYASGLFLFVLYAGNPRMAGLMNTNPDALLPSFFFDRLPAGALGLMLATILAATLSCLTAGMNSLSASTIVDLYAQARSRPRSPQHLVLAGRLVTVAWGVIISLGAAWVGNMGGGIMEMSYVFLGLALSLNLGIFLTGMLIPRAGERALQCGVAFGVLLSLWIVRAGFHWLWYSFFGGASVILVSWLVSYWMDAPPAARVNGLTWWTRGLPVAGGDREPGRSPAPDAVQV